MYSRQQKPEPRGSNASPGQQALTVEAGELGLAPTADRPRVWGVVMETGYASGVATLVVFAEGTTSLYFSNGGGVVGAGRHEAVRRAGEALLSVVETHVQDLTQARDTSLPEVGRVRLYVRTFKGTLGAEALEEDLGRGRHRLSSVFHAAHSVISAVRLSSAER